MFSRKNARTVFVMAAAVAPVVAGLTAARANLPTGSGPFTNSSSGQAIISLSGSSALKGFFGSANAYYLEPPSTGSGNNTIEFGGTTYTANSTTGSILLAPLTQGGGAIAQGNGTNEGAGIEVQYLVTGSVEGCQGLIQSQLNSSYLDSPAGSGNGYTNLNLSSSYYCYINSSTNKFTGPNTINSYTLANQTSDTIGAATNSQSAVQIAVSDVPCAQAFSYGGGNATGSIFATPGQTGYGKGNPTRTVNPLVLTGNSTVTAGGAAQLHDQTDIGATLGSGNISNLTNTEICAGASLLAANPGTGLTQLDKTDAQFLQAAARLSNGLGFNVTTRDVGSGTRNTIANNTGIDPSWAVGTNDNGNGNALSVNNQLSIGEVNGNATNGPLGGIKFSNKTSGGSQLLPVLENARMSIGTISQSDASAADCDGTNNGDATSVALSTTPVRALSYNASTSYSTGTAVAVSAQNIINGNYAIWQQEQFVTINGGSDGILGDDTHQDAKNYISLITNSVARYPNVGTYQTEADGLVAQKWIPPQFMEVSKTVDGGNVSSVTPTGNVSLFLASSDANLFNVATPTNLTNGAGGFYAQANVAGVAGTPNYAGGNFTEGKVLITAQNSSGGNLSGASATQAASVGGNWLFGNFNQNGIRDLSAVEAAGQALLDGSAIFSGNGTLDLTTGALNGNSSTAYTNSKLNAMNSGAGATKGDLVVLGDFNSDGKFDGADLYAMATQVAASDGNATSPSNYTAGTIGGNSSTFGANVLNAVLRKNTAMDSFKTMFASTGNSTDNNIRMAADLSKPYINASEAGNNSYANAFNKFDVLGNGYYSPQEKLQDAAAVCAAIGSSYTNLNQSVTTTVTVQGSTYPVNLTMAKLTDATANDTGNTTITTADFQLIANDIGSTTLLAGDAQFNGTVNFNDYSILQNNYNQSGRTWSTGDWNNDGVCSFYDYSLLQNNYNKSAFGTVSGSALVSKVAIAKSGNHGALVGAALAANGLAKPSITPATAPTVTYVLSVNDDGTGHYAAGHFAIYASDTTGNNGGLASYGINLGGVNTVSNFSPKGIYDDGTGCGNSDEIGFTSLRSANNVAAVTGTQDTVGYAGGSGVILAYGLGQTAGNLATLTAAGSTGGSQVVQAVYGAPLELVKGTYNIGAPSFINTSVDSGNVFVNTTGYGTEAPTLSFSSVTLSSGVHTALLSITTSGSPSSSYIGTSHAGGANSSTVTVTTAGGGYSAGFLNGINAGNASNGVAKISGFSGSDAQIIGVAISVSDAGNGTLHAPSAQELADIITDLNANTSLPGGATATVEAFNGSTAGTLQHDDLSAYSLLSGLESTYGGKTLELAVLINGLTSGGSENFGLNFSSENVDGITGVKLTDIAAVPEPATMSLLLLGGLPMLGRRRRKA